MPDSRVHMSEGIFGKLDEWQLLYCAVHSRQSMYCQSTNMCRDLTKERAKTAVECSMMLTDVIAEHKSTSQSAAT